MDVTYIVNILKSQLTKFYITREETEKEERRTEYKEV